MWSMLIWVSYVAKWCSCSVVVSVWSGSLAVEHSCGPFPCLHQVLSQPSFVLLNCACLIPKSADCHGGLQILVQELRSVLPVMCARQILYLPSYVFCFILCFDTCWDQHRLWLLLCVFVPACVYSKSSIVLGLAITVPLIVASLSVSLPIWVHNGYRFYLPPAWEHSTNGACETQARHGKSKEVSYTE